MPTFRRYRRRRFLKSRARRSRYLRFGMGYKKSRSSYSRKIRRMRKRNYKTPRNLRVVKLPRQMWPQRVMAKLDYYDTIPIGNGVSTYAEYVFSMNSIYDPDVTGTGHQPRGRDQWANMYNKYIVRGCRYRVSAYAADATAATASAVHFMVGVAEGPVNLQFNFSSLNDWLEYPKTKYIKLKKGTRNTSYQSISVAPPDSQTTKMKGYCSMKALYNQFGGIDLNNSAQRFEWPVDYESPMGSSPPCEQYLTFFAGSLPQSGADSSTLLAVPDIHFQVYLTYYVEFLDPVYPSAS